MNQSEQTCHLSEISHTPPTPVQMFQSIIEKFKLDTQTNPLVMNLATVDKDFGVLNRSVIYRGLTKEYPSNICFVTERNSRKFENLKENPKLALTIVCSSPEELWQIRLFNAEAHELNDEVIKALWQKELLFAKIRSNICATGKPSDREELGRECWEIFQKHEKESKEPEQTKTYTAFKIVPKLWDFYKSEPNKIADRVHYKLIEGEQDKWEIYHVDA